MGASAMESPSPIRVLQILEATEGGTARHLLDLLRHLPRDRFAVDAILSPSRDPRFPADVESSCPSASRIDWVPMARQPSLTRDAAVFYRVTARLRREKYDLIHTHSTKAGVLGRLAGRVACPNAKRVHTPHAFPFLMRIGMARRRAYELIEQRLASLTDRFIAVSAGERARVLALSPTARVSVVYNGIDATRYEGAGAWRECVRSKWGIAQDDFVIGCVGRLTAQKGQRSLLAALGALGPVALHRVKVLLIGDGEDRCDLERLADQSGARDRVIFAGQQDEVERLYGAMDLYVLPSLYEGLPYTLLEAMAAGLPCLATDVDGSREVVRDGVTGRLVPAREARALTAAIDEAVRSPDVLRRWGEAGRRRAGEEFTIERMIERLTEAYEQTLHGEHAS